MAESVKGHLAKCRKVKSEKLVDQKVGPALPRSEPPAPGFPDPDDSQITGIFVEQCYRERLAEEQRRCREAVAAVAAARAERERDCQLLALNERLSLGENDAGAFKREDLRDLGMPTIDEHLQDLTTTHHTNPLIRGAADYSSALRQREITIIRPGNTLNT